MSCRIEMNRITSSAIVVHTDHALWARSATGLSKASDFRFSIWATAGAACSSAGAFFTWNIPNTFRRHVRIGRVIAINILNASTMLLTFTPYTKHPIATGHVICTFRACIGNIGRKLCVLTRRQTCPLRYFTLRKAIRITVARKVIRRILTIIIGCALSRFFALAWSRTVIAGLAVWSFIASVILCWRKIVGLCNKIPLSTNFCFILHNYLVLFQHSILGGMHFERWGTMSVSCQ